MRTLRAILVRLADAWVRARETDNRIRQAQDGALTRRGPSII